MTDVDPRRGIRRQRYIHEGAGERPKWDWLLRAQIRPVTDIDSAILSRDQQRILLLEHKTSIYHGKLWIQYGQLGLLKAFTRNDQTSAWIIGEGQAGKWYRLVVTPDMEHPAPEPGKFKGLVVKLPISSFEQLTDPQLHRDVTRWWWTDAPENSGLCS